MSQVNLPAGVPQAAPFPTTDAAALLKALVTLHSGSSRPVVVTAEGEGLWVKKVSGTQWELRYYDGTSDLLIGTFNPTTHTWLPAGARELLTGNRTYYVRTDGSDSNTGLVDNAGGAFLTIQKAINVVFGTLDLGGNNVTIQVRNGTYAGAAQLSSQVGAGTVFLTGDTTTPSNVVISTSGTCILVAGFGTKLAVQGFKFTSSAGSCLYISTGGYLQLNGKVEFGSAAGYHIFVDSFGYFYAFNIAYTISGNAYSHMNANVNGVILSQAITWTLTGTPAFSNFCVCSNNSTINSTSNTVASGTATGTRYLGLNGAVIITNGGGANYFPGNAAGSVDATSVYV